MNNMQYNKKNPESCTESGFIMCIAKLRLLSDYSAAGVSTSAAGAASTDRKSVV